MRDKFNMVGTKIPEFDLANTKGEIVNIKEFQGKKNVLLVLNRALG